MIDTLSMMIKIFLNERDGPDHFDLEYVLENGHIKSHCTNYCTEKVSPGKKRKNHFKTSKEMQSSFMSEKD